MIILDLFGDPVPQARPRFCRKGQFTTTYDSQSKLKEAYKWQIKSQFRENPISGPVFMDLIFFMPIPASQSGIKKRQMANGMIHHMKRPDIDNLSKFVLDCLNDIVLTDDSQIVEIRARKVYSSKPGTSIRIKNLNQLSENIYEDSARDSRQPAIH